MKRGWFPNLLSVYSFPGRGTPERGFDMRIRALAFGGLTLLLVPAALAQKEAREETVRCRVMEVFVSERTGTTAVIFHQRDKADGPRLGELLLARSGEEVEFEMPDARRHRATVARMKSCFGRGMLLFATSEAKLAEKDDFVLRLPVKD